MSRSFASIGAFVAFMGGRIATLPAAQKRALDKASDVVLTEAKSLPGKYQDGWAHLTTSTLHGGVSPEGYHYKGKIPLGYATEGDHKPLLRDGGMRDSYGAKVVSPHKAVVGSNDPKATWQELGTSRGIPPRPVLKTAAVRKEGEVRRIIGETVVAHLAGRTNH